MEKANGKILGEALGEATWGSLLVNSLREVLGRVQKKAIVKPNAKRD